MELTAEVRRFYSELRQISFVRDEREDPQQNLIEPLELVAVMAGLKPTYLGGHGGHCLELLQQIEEHALRFGLHTVWNESVSPYDHVVPDVDRTFWNYVIEQNHEARLAAPKCLWAYRDESEGDKIRRCVSGELSVAAVLGYPECCTEHHFRHRVGWLESLAKAYRKREGAKTADALVSLYRKQVSSRVEWPEDLVQKELYHSLERYPFVHFTACPNCIDADDSPAAAINTTLQELATSLEPRFAAEFKKYAANPDFYQVSDFLEHCHAVEGPIPTTLS